MIGRRELIALPLGPALMAQHAQENPTASRGYLAGLWTVPVLTEALGGARYFPARTERARWEAIPADAREAAIEQGVAALAGEWGSLPATVFLEYKREGNRSRYEAIRNVRRNRLQQLVVAEVLENRGRFLEAILNGVWLTCEETYWGLPAHLGLQKAGTGLPDVEEPTVDLFAADTGSLMAWTLDLVGAKLAEASPLVTRRIAYEVRRRILDPLFERTDFGWMGLDPKRPRSVNNWNPWIVSNWLTCALLLEPAERRARAVHKAIVTVDRFLDGYGPDGGCDEGPSYWGHAGGSFYECLELLYRASAGRLSIYGEPGIGEMARYIYRTHIDQDWYVNFADASARIQVNGPLIYGFGKRVQDPAMMRHGAYALRLGSTGRALSGSIARQLDGLLLLEEMRKAPADAPLVWDSWMPSIGVMTARQRAGSSEGWFVAVQGGHNAESHNHNDVGNFVVFHNGKPVLIDVGVETYTAKTFSARRYEIWTMRSSYHNLPTVNGVEQGAGRKFEARKVASERTAAEARMSLSLAAAYPAEAGIREWDRTVQLDRASGVVTIRDAWRLDRADSIEQNLMLAIKPVVSGRTVTVGAARIELPAGFQAQVDEIKTGDARLRPVWGEAVYRLRARAERPAAAGESVIRVTA
jgi:hypothetical protein